MVGQVLADAIADAHTAALEFDHANGNPIHIEHDVRTTLLLSIEGDFLGDREIIGFWVVPINQGDRGCGLIGGSLYLHPVAKQGIDATVGFIEAHLADIGCAAELIESTADLRFAVAAALQGGAEDGLFDVAVASALLPVAQVAVAQLVLKQAQHPLLGGALEAEAAHGVSCWVEGITTQRPALVGPSWRTRPSARNFLRW